MICGWHKKYLYRSTVGYLCPLCLVLLKNKLRALGEHFSDDDALPPKMICVSETPK